MCVDAYVSGVIVRDRLEELRADAARARLVLQTAPPLRVSLGRSLIRLGRWLAAAERIERAQAA
jgi:hypothetical protein